MDRQDAARKFDARDEDKGHVATGNERVPTHDIDDLPTEHPVPGDFVPRSLPSGSEGDVPTEMASKENDSESSEGIAELKEMEQNAEDGREWVFATPVPQSNSRGELA
ncbi:hypothetical protein LuPra_02596 [Luteitalea pratensis]|uniref:Uncharacterized protein n=1 Tax=Luteitalea pratensis TaxID=1855912 RepID=A0A143PLL2_LUTPR|nr:hypothetical protein [Luteitalea pratensis]AMY09381.1 hypothetical protein LuPra_02596 [Luteitalea pratensis]